MNHGGGKQITQSAKFLLCKNEHLSLDSQHSCKMTVLVMLVCNSRARKGEGEIPSDQWPVCKASPMSQV